MEGCFYMQTQFYSTDKNYFAELTTNLVSQDTEQFVFGLNTCSFGYTYHSDN